MSRIAQVGGRHYESDGVQHWDVMEDHDVAYLEATATKYIVRWDRKGTPELDLGKARSYLKRILQARRNVRRGVPYIVLHQFYLANNMDAEKQAVITLILDPQCGTQDNLRTTIFMIEEIMRREGFRT
jgi:hypothetical protein